MDFDDFLDLVSVMSDHVSKEQANAVKMQASLATSVSLSPILFV